MSYGVSAYLLDLTRFLSIPGSQNPIIWAEVLELNESRIADHDAEWLVHFSPYLPLAQAVQQIVDGNIDDQANPPFQYEHAAVLIARTLGEALDSEMFSEMRGAFWDDVNCLIETARESWHLDPAQWPTPRDVLNRGPLLDVPLDPKSPRESGYILPWESQAITASTHTIDLEKTAYRSSPLWLDEAKTTVEQYRNWIRQSGERNLCLFLHY